MRTHATFLWANRKYSATSIIFHRPLRMYDLKIIEQRKKNEMHDSINWHAVFVRWPCAGLFCNEERERERENELFLRLLHIFIFCYNTFYLSIFAYWSRNWECIRNNMAKGTWTKINIHFKMCWTKTIYNRITLFASSFYILPFFDILCYFSFFWISINTNKTKCHHIVVYRQNQPNAGTSSNCTINA